MKKNHSQITNLAALLVFTVFALCVLLVLLTGANLYRSLVEDGEAQYLRRTSLQYLTTRIRQAEAVEVGTFQGCPALILEEAEDCTTWVYCYEGWLRELYTVPGAQVLPGDGEALLEAEALSLQQEGNLLTLTLDEDTLYLWLPEGRLVEP